MTRLSHRLIGLLMLAATAAHAQQTAPAPADVASPEAAVQAVYSVISGPKGTPRDWSRLRSLMAPGGVFVVTGTPPGGVLRTRVLTVDDFIASASKNIAAEGFYERGVIGTVWRYGHIATIRSPYESRHAPGEPPFQRGINSFQLSTDGTRWWIVSIAWEGETPAFPLPPTEDAQLRAR
jgi:hypothetical protein